MGNFKISKTDHISLIVAAVTWLKYCRYGVKLYPIKPNLGKRLHTFENRRSAINNVNRADASCLPPSHRYMSETQSTLNSVIFFRIGILD